MALRGWAAGAVAVAFGLVAGSCARNDAVAAASDHVDRPTTTIEADRFSAPTTIEADRFSAPTTSVVPLGLSAPSPVAPSPVAPSPSIGCDDRVAATADGAVSNDGGFTFGGQKRTYLRHRPAESGGPSSTDGPLPVVIDFHALGDTARAHAGLVSLTTTADRHGFVLITPQGLGSPSLWNVTKVPLVADDIGFVAALLERIEASDCIDTNRIYATGFSVGGIMAALVACELDDRIAAVAPVAGLIHTACPTSRPVPVIAFHGTADAVLPYDGGVGEDAADSVATPAGLAVVKNLDPGPVRQSMAIWAADNGCDPVPADERVGDDVVASRWSRCDGDAAVELYTIEGGGHSWPGSAGFASLDGFGRTSLTVDANEVMWRFFAAHPLRRSSRS